MNNRRVKIWLLCTAAAVLAGCYNYDEDLVASGIPVSVDLAYTFSSATGGQTRQADALVQNSTQRRPDNLYIIALKDDNPSISNITMGVPVKKEGVGEKPTSYLFHSSSCDMITGVNSCHVYGSVADVTPPGGVDTKVYNGSIILPTNLSSVTTQDAIQNLSFSLESIWDNKTNGLPEGVSTVAGHLTEVANAHTEGGLYWKNSKNEILKNLFINFTNHENNMPGSEAAVKKWLGILVTAVNYYLDNSPASLQTNELAILNAVKTAANTQISAIDANPTNYPRNKHLPDGAAVLRWVRSTANGDAFQPRMDNTSLDNINGVSRFAYPAPLFYYINSTLKTSKSSVDYYTTNFDGVITEATKTAWEKVLDVFNDGPIVTVSTKSVALKEPVQYAVAQLQLTVKAATATLEDAKANTVTLSSTSFPLKGVIIGDQRPVNYRFEPVSSDVDTKFIYDSQVQDPDGHDYYLTTTDPNGAGPSTLVLQSRYTEDVNIILEFENNSGQDFEGVNGTVYAGTRFYLIGKVSALKESQVINSQEETKQVFTKDYITKVNMIVSSLAKAYSVLPNLLKSNLEIGVEATPQWIAATPTVIRLE